MNPSALAFILTSFLLGSALTIQLLVLPILINRISDRSTVSRVSIAILRSHHLLSIPLLIATAVLWIVVGNKLPAAIAAGALAVLSLYQRFWLFTKLHLIKQPIGVQDLIQPDNVLREESNKLHRRAFLIFRIHLFLLLIDLVLGAI